METWASDPLNCGTCRERQMRIEDAYGRLDGHAPRGTTPA